MKPYIKKRLCRGVAMLFQNLLEEDVKLVLKKGKTSCSLKILVPTDEGDEQYKEFVGDSFSTLQKLAFDWLRVSLYDTYRAKKSEFDSSIRKIVSIEKYVFDTYEVSLNPRR